MVDHFTDGEGNSYTIMQRPKLTLTQYLADLGEQQSIGVKSVAIWIHMVAMILRNLAAKRILHRNICMENIVVRKKKSKRRDDG